VRVFVTGGTGFVGSHLVEALLERGDEVVCLVRDPAKLRRRFPQNAPQSIEGNLHSEAALRSGCEGADVVFHSAGLTMARSRAEFFAVNAEATRRMVDAAAATAPNLQRFVYISSQSAGGPSRRGVRKTETDPADPVSDYGASKLAGEKLVQQSGLPWTVARPPSVYGPHDTAFLTVFKLARLGFLPLFGDGLQELSLIHISDLVDALLLCSAAGTASRTYFTCHPDTITTAQFARTIHRAVKHSGGKTPRPLVLRFPNWAARATLQITGAAARLVGKATMLSPDKAKELLAEAWTCSAAALERDTGWKATIGHEQGLQQTADWYKKHGWL
jgi:nucleoside-diphosphate-sugar epimerase